MANQTDLSSGNHSCILEISNLAVSNLAVMGWIKYAVKHLGLDNQGNVCTTLVKFTTDNTVPDPTTFVAVNNQRILQAGDVEYPKRGGVDGLKFSSLSFKAANATNAVLIQVSVIESLDGGFEQ